MKLFVVLAVALVAAATAAPQYKSVRLSALTSSFEPQIPEGCTFLSNTQELVAGVIKGEYSYQDPVGSTIIVTYSMNQDGTNYEESRKIIKAKTDAEIRAERQVFIDQLIITIDTKLKPSVISIVSATVKAASAESLAQYQNLVEVIAVQLRPVVYNEFQTALYSSEYAGQIEAEELTKLLMVKLRPEIRQGVEAQIRELQAEQARLEAARQEAARREAARQEAARREAARQEAARREAARQEAARQEAARREAARKEAARQAAARQTFIDQLIITIDNKLRSSVISIVSSAVRSASAETLDKYENLVEIIATQLRPIVFAEFKKDLAISTNQYARLVQPEELTQLLMAKLRPEIRLGVEQQIRELKAEQARQEAARQEAARREAARREAARLEAARREAARQEAARKEAARLEAARREAARLEAARQEAARREAARQEAARQAAARQTFIDQLIITIDNKLRSSVISIVSSAVRSASPESLAKYENLVEIIATQLRPIVFAEFKKDLAISTNQYARLVQPEELTQLLMAKLRPEIREGVEAQIRALKAEQARQEAARQAAARQAFIDQLIITIDNKLRSSVISIVSSAVRSASPESLAKYENLVEIIATQLRPIVFAEFKKDLAVSSSQYARLIQPEELTRLLMAKLRPEIRQGVEQQIRELKAEQARQEAARQEAARREAARREAARLEAARLAEQARLEAARKEAARLEAERLEAARLEAARLEAARLEAARLEAARLEAARLEAIRVAQQAQGQIVSGIVVYFEVSAKDATTQYLVSGKGAGQSEDAIASAIIASLRAQIQSRLESQLRGLEAFSAGYLSVSDVTSELMGQILAQMRVFIIRQVQLYRAEQARLVTPAPATKIVSLFGTGKGNSVVIDTKNYHVDYSFDSISKRK